MSRRAALVVAVGLLAAPPLDAAAEIEQLGEATVSREAPGVQGPIGGLSGWTYDAETGAYYVISDDRSRFAPARFYRLSVDLSDGRLDEGDVRVLGHVELRSPDGSPYPSDVIDPEGLARGPQGTWWVASEGNAKKKVPASISEFSAEGLWLGELRLPRAFSPRRRSGVRHNLGFESATISPDGRWLFTATENALKQDGDRATADAGSASRLLRFDLHRQRLDSSYLYRTEPIAEAPQGEAFAVNGLVDLLALSEVRLLALERSFTAGKGNVARLFEIDLSGATDVTRFRRLEGRSGLAEISKRLLLDVGALGIEPENLEGMTFGPTLADGRRTLLLIADDNFNPRAQRSQVLAFALAEDPVAR